MKSFLRFLIRLLYGFRAFNVDALNAPGPVLLLPNHSSWIDWLFIGVCLDDDWKFVVSRESAETSWLHKKIMINRRTFPVEINSPYAVRRMAEYLQKGGRLVLFPEGRISRTGSLMRLFDGTGFLLHKTNAKVITAYLRGAFRLPYSTNPNWKRFLQPVTAHFSDVLTPPKLENVTTMEARTTLTDWLYQRMVNQQFEVEMEFGENTVLEAIVASARQRPKKIVLQDATMKTITNRRLLVGASLLAGQWRKRFGESEQRIGVMLPNVNATPVTILSLWAANKVPAILNYTSGMATMLACVQLAGLKQIITSQAFVTGAKLDIAPLKAAGIEILFLEDVRAGISGWQKFCAALRGRFNCPLPIANHQSPDSTAVVLFTSGSEAAPKGVELTHKNLLANVRQMSSVMDLMDTDRFFNAMPLFHSFGLAVGTLLPLTRGIFTFIYLSPLHYRVIPAAFYNLDCTVLFGTNTFLNGYARRANPYDFRSLRYLCSAAEKLQEATANVWMQKYGVRILEGYGATECSPCISVNTKIRPRTGSTGKFLPGIEWKVEAVEGVTEGGRLFVRGPNIMRGYLNADANEKFKSLGGWYDTGDIVSVDKDGFLFILGRLKRFAKVSGEMVSLTAVEDALAGAFPQYGLRFSIAVIARQDSEKGEKLIAVTNEPRLQLDEVRAAIRAKGLSNISAPREIKAVKEFPKLGTGKVNYRELEKLV